MTPTVASNLISCLSIISVVALIVIAVLVLLYADATASRRRAETRSVIDRVRRNNAEERVRRMLLDAEPVRPEPAETQRLPRVPHAPTYRPAAVAAPSTALVPRGDRLPVRSR